MGYQLSMVRLKRGLSAALPLSLDGVRKSPLAGPFDRFTRTRMLHAIERFPFARHLDGVHDTFEIEAPGGGRLEVLLTTDGNLFVDSQAGLELTLALYLELQQLCPELAIEDPQRAELHDARSYRAWLQDCVTSERPAPPAESEEDAA